MTLSEQPVGLPPETRKNQGVSEMRCPADLRPFLQLLLEDRVVLVPEPETEVYRLVQVAEIGLTGLVPTRGRAAGVLVRDVLPGLAGGAGVFADRTPGSIGEVRLPLLPVGAAGLRVVPVRRSRLLVVKSSSEGSRSSRTRASTGRSRFP